MRNTFIRTEDGVYNRNKIICYAFNPNYHSDNWDKDIELYLQKPILREADSVEKLCDGFIIDWGTHFAFQEDFNIASKNYGEYQAIYGVILVRGEHGEPILKPVAKMPIGKTEWEKVEFGALL